MAASKKFKFSGSTIAVLTDFSADSPADVITGITNANPAVVTSAAHGMANGDVVRIDNVVGMTEVNDEVFIIERLSANTYSLLDTNSTDYGTYVSGGTSDQASFSNFCELTSYDTPGGSKPEIDATSLCSTAAEYELGLRDFGSTSAGFFFAPQTAIQLALAAFDTSGEKMAVRVDLPKQGGRMVQLGFIQQNGASVGVNGIWTGTVTIRNTGPRADFAAA